MASDDDYLFPYSDDEGNGGEEIEANDGVKEEIEEEEEEDSHDMDLATVEGPDRSTPYEILDEDQIQKLQEEDIASVSSVLSIPKPHATLLLRHYKWNVAESQDEWFADEERVRKAVGLLPSPAQASATSGGRKRKQVCGICFGSYRPSELRSAACGHRFCRDCWAAYIAESVSNGPGCLALLCPTPKCGAAVGPDMFDLLGGDEERKKYRRYLLRSYVEDNPKRKWCPAPGCSCAVDFVVGSEVRDVCCKCSHSFCWQCSEEAHRPLSCEMVAKWIEKNNSESETTNWVLAYTKPCPKCKKPIEKNQGCMHMTCRPPCRFEFCWLCLQPYARHYQAICNGYREDRQAGAGSVSARRERAKEALQRYVFYYERWAAHHSSGKKAAEAMREWKAEKLEKLISRQGWMGDRSRAKFDFVIEAFSRIVECRNVLKWAYAYGYYLTGDEPDKKSWLESMQGSAEVALEKLHWRAEKELEVYLDRKATPPEEFAIFRLKLVDLTTLTGKYFKELIQVLENRMRDYSQLRLQGYSRRKYNLQLVDELKRLRIGTNSGEDGCAMAAFGVFVDGKRACAHCTFANPADATVCQVCDRQIL